MEERLPEGTKLNFVIDQSEFVRQAIEALIHEGLIGAALVSLMILIFLGNWRMALIACIFIALSLLFDVINMAYERTSEVVTTNHLPFEQGTEVLSSERLVGATQDRLTHRCHLLTAKASKSVRPSNRLNRRSRFTDFRAAPR
jgi:hypothetical protein